MKILRVLLLCAAFAAGFLLAGCGMISSGAQKTGVIQPVTSTTVVTNIVERPVITIVTNFVTVGEISPPVFVTNFVPLITIQTNTVTNSFAVNPAVSGGIDLAKGVNSSLNPTPSEPIINLVLTGLSGVLGLVAAWQTKRLGTSNTVAATLVQNVEQLRTAALQIPGYTPAMDHEVMTGIQAVQNAAGGNVAGAIADLVGDLTGDTLTGQFFQKVPGAAQIIAAVKSTGA